MGVLLPSAEDEVFNIFRIDDPKKLEEAIEKYKINKETVLTENKRTLIQLCCYFSSSKCLLKLIELGFDYKTKEISNNCTPLFIACKFDCLEIVKILLNIKENPCDLLVKNNEGFNEFEIAFLRGNYKICFYLLYGFKGEQKSENIEEENINDLNNIYNDDNNRKKDDNKENKEDDEIIFNKSQPYQKYFFSKEFNLEKYISLQLTNQYPLFNMTLFYKSLIDKIKPQNCESFAPERKRTKDLKEKIPDPNETWTNFAKRLTRFELYNPPLVDKSSVGPMNSMYMNTQMKLIENEYGVKMKYEKPKKLPFMDAFDEESVMMNEMTRTGYGKKMIKIEKVDGDEPKKGEREEEDDIEEINYEEMIKENNRKNKSKSVNVFNSKDEFKRDVNNKRSNK